MTWWREVGIGNRMTALLMMTPACPERTKLLALIPSCEFASQLYDRLPRWLWLFTKDTHNAHVTPYVFGLSPAQCVKVAAAFVGSNKSALFDSLYTLHGEDGVRALLARELTNT